MRFQCWAIKTISGLVKDYRDPEEGFKALTFMTRKAARQWLNAHPYYRGEPVKIKILVEIKDY